VNRVCTAAGISLLLVSFAAFADSITSVSPPSYYLYDVEEFVTLRDSPETADVGGAGWPRVSSLLAPGTVTSSELERENGKLIYSFDIKTSKSGVTEVNVNAIDGKIVAVAHENAKKEADEKKQEEKEKKKQ
jgi:hypothetical protein